MVTTALGSGRGGSEQTLSLPSFSVTPIAQPGGGILLSTGGGGGGSGSVPGLNISPTGPGSPSGGSTTRGTASPLSGPIATGSGPGSLNSPGGTSGIVAGFGSLAENLPRFNWTHIALFLLIGLGLYLLWPRISKQAGRTVKGVRG